MGLAYSTTRKLLLKEGVTLRTNKSVSFLKNQQQSFKSSAPPPYGYCYLEGQFQKDPREFPILQIICKQRQQMSHEGGDSGSMYLRINNDLTFELIGIHTGGYLRESFGTNLTSPEVIHGS